jgi:hypothetical protein
VTWTATDSSGHSTSCDLTVSITDDEAPIHELGCDDVTGVTDAGQSYGTVGAGSLSLAQPVFIDNSGESDGAGLVYTVHMGQAAVDDSSEFLYMNSQAAPDGALGQSRDSDGNMITTVTWTATDSSGHSTSCDLTVSITDDEAPIHELGCDDVTGVTDAGQSYGTVGAGSLSLAQPVFIDNSGESDGAGLVYTVHMGQAAVDDSSEFLYTNSQAAPDGALGQSLGGNTIPPPCTASDVAATFPTIGDAVLDRNDVSTECKLRACRYMPALRRSAQTSWAVSDVCHLSTVCFGTRRHRMSVPAWCTVQHWQFDRLVPEWLRPCKRSFHRGDSWDLRARFDHDSDMDGH